MRKFKKWISLLLCLTVAAFPMTACSSGTDTSSEASAVSSAVSESSAEPETESSTPESSAQEQPDTITVIDHADNEVTVPREIDRVVVTDIYPLASVLTVFLGSAEKLVGIHPVSMSAAESGLLGEIFPEILNAETGFMTGSDLNIEELLMLDPDVVFYTAGNTELKSALDNAGIPAVGVSPSKWNYDILETYDQWIALLSQIFPEHAKTDMISEYSQEIYDMVQERVADIPEEERKEILFLFQYSDQQMITSGKNFFGQFWAEAVGGHNAAEEVEADNSNAVISMEQVYQWNPDVIFITNFTPAQPEDLYQNAIGGDDWSSVEAVKTQQVYKLPLGTYRSYTPSADTPVTLLWMAQKVYPELFEDIDITAEVRDYYQELYGIELTDEQIDRMYNPSSSAADGFQS